MAIKEWWEAECSNCNMYHCDRLICEDCVKEEINKELKKYGRKKR